MLYNVNKIAYPDESLYILPTKLHEHVIKAELSPSRKVLVAKCPYT